MDREIREEKQIWEPEIEEDEIMEEVEFLAEAENMTKDEALANLPEYKSIASGYIDYLIAQKNSRV